MEDTDFAKILARKMSEGSLGFQKLASTEDELRADLAEALGADRLIRNGKKVRGRSLYQNS